MPEHELFRGRRPPAPPEGLRRRALDAARSHSLVARPSPWQRLWEQPGLRLAWVATVVALVAGHVALSVPDAATDPPLAPKIRVASASLDASTAPLVALDRIDGRHLPNF
jgi:hypothetical protein